MSKNVRLIGGILFGRLSPPGPLPLLGIPALPSSGSCGSGLIVSNSCLFVMCLPPNPNGGHWVASRIEAPVIIITTHSLFNDHWEGG